jgi:hypothetical protein
VEGTTVLTTLLKKLKMNENHLFARSEEILSYLGTYGITMLLLTALLLALILLA